MEHSHWLLPLTSPQECRERKSVPPVRAAFLSPFIGPLTVTLRLTQSLAYLVVKIGNYTFQKTTKKPKTKQKNKQKHNNINILTAVEVIIIAIIIIIIIMIIIIYGSESSTNRMTKKNQYSCAANTVSAPMYTAKVQGRAKVMDTRHIALLAPPHAAYIYMHHFYK